MSSIKLSFLLRRKSEFTRQEFQKYWREQHAPLVARHAKKFGIVRYIQVHTTANAETFPGRVVREAPEPYDGIAEVWMDPSTATGTEEEKKQASEEILADEAKFISLKESPLWLGEEHVILGD